MSTSAHLPSLDPCGCCEAETPQHAHYNRPGQPALAYRLGTHASFLRRMLSRLSTQRLPNGARPLAYLTTRDGADPAIALLDGWAAVADVLTFYQERIANEGYLRTATERRSVLELARAIGYELNPGVAAGAFLAFTVEQAPAVAGATRSRQSTPLTGIPDVITVPEGTKVQSVPGQDELPQTFETVEKIEVRAAWNDLRPRQSRPAELALIGDRLCLVGLSTAFPPDTPNLHTLPQQWLKFIYPLRPSVIIDPSQGDVQVAEIGRFYLKGINASLKAGDLLLFVGKNHQGLVKALTFTVRKAISDAEADRTQVDLADDAALPPFAPAELPLATVSLEETPFDQEQVQAIIRQQAWRERDLSAFMKVQGWQEKQLLAALAAPPADEGDAVDQGVFVLRQRLGFFGHNAPLFGSLPKGDEMRSDPYAANNSNWDAANENTGRTIWTDSWGVSYPTRYAGLDVFLERSVAEVTTDSWIVVRDPGVGAAVYRVQATNDVSVTGYGLGAKATGLTLKQPDGETAPNKGAAFKVRRSTAFVQSERLTLAALPIDDPLAQGATSLMLDEMTPGLTVGRPVILGGERDDAPGVIKREALILADIVHSGGYTVLYFQNGLTYSYVRQTVTLSANVARATHGETVREVLGSGDGAQANQRFTLKKPPLTYVSAATPSGGQSTLTVRVNDVAWQEQPALYGLTPHSESYTVHIDNEGRASVIFGDGGQGARLPTGPENITATYRSGLGLDGEVGASRLTLLLSRPLGIRGVTNPLPASGAANPETLATARDNAPLTVRTLDRIVSLQDYEDFALSFAGVGKARAIVLWNGDDTVVHITVATASGQPVEAESDLRTNLVAAIAGVRNPLQPVVVDTFTPLFFDLQAGLLVDSRYIAATVLAAAEAALQAAFAFEQRAFGQPVTAAEVVSAIQQVDGVIAVDLDQLYLTSDPAGPSQTEPEQILPAHLARWPRSGSRQRAELLLINPAGGALKEMKL